MKCKDLSPIQQLRNILCGIVCCSMPFAAAQELPDDYKLGCHTVAEWKTILDTTWGEGRPTEEKLYIFDTYWDMVDQHFAGFVNNPVNWDSIYTHYRPTIEAGVSRGKFAGIMANTFLSLMEVHTKAIDMEVFITPPAVDVPILILGYAFSPYAINNQGHFGAALTPLDDGSSFVIRVIDNHPLGLELGDRIVGYDGVSWENLYPMFMALNFPITSNETYYEPGLDRQVPILGHGSSIDSRDFTWQRSVGLNWHLFDSINVVKYNTTDTLSFATSLLESLDTVVSGVDISTLAGIEFLGNYWEETWISGSPTVFSGFIEDSTLGYICVWNWWSETVSEEFSNALQTMKNSDIEGIVLDYRYNEGGNEKMKEGYNLIMNVPVRLLPAYRQDPEDRFLLLTDPDSWGCTFEYDGTGSFDRPVAVMTGPRVYSYGDNAAYIIQKHSMSRVFGKGTSTAHTCAWARYNTPEAYDHQNQPLFLGEAYADWYFAIANTTTVDQLGEDSIRYLMHKGLTVDEEVWLTPEATRNGEDAVVSRAIEWIQNLAYAHDVQLSSGYVPPGYTDLQLSAIVENPDNHDLLVHAGISCNNELLEDSIILSPAIDRWEALLPVPENEAFYKVSITTDDLAEGSSRTLPDIVRYTTAGPLRYEDITLTGTDATPNPGDRITFKISLYNEGQELSIPSIMARLTSLDEQAVTGISSKDFPDIAPGESALNTANYVIDIDESCPAGTAIPIQIDIASEGYFFWTDTFTLVVQEPLGIDQLAEPLVRIFPNPVNDKLNVEISYTGTQLVQLELYSVTGKLVYGKSESGIGYFMDEIDVSEISPGLYFLKIQQEGGVFTEKVVIR